MKKRISIWRGISVLVLSVLLGGCRRADSTLLLATQQENEEDSVETGTEDISANEEGLYIYICGEVTNPGVYILGAHSRLCDAVEAAGGMTESASRTYWNLAMELSDGQMIYVPTMEEAAERDFSPLSADGTAVSDGEPGGIDGDGKVNINRATKEQLMTIPGIGEAKADSIIAYRETNGDYAAIEDIMNVSGIKDGLFQSMKEYITVD
jgi:competence protein ComEA